MGQRWTTDRDDELRRHHAAGLSRAQIAREMGCTRNSICGRLSRLGLSGDAGLTEEQRQLRAEKRRQSHNERQQQRYKVRRVNIVQMFREPPPRIDDANIPIGQRRSIMELNSATCRYIVGDPAETHFYCGGQIMEGSSFCPGHYARCHDPTQRQLAEAA